MAEFLLHARLSADCTLLGELPLCSLLLLNDSRYPWFILVPRRADISEIYQMSEADQARFWAESTQFGQSAMELFGGDKLNIGALGNMVAQLHVHHIIRYQSDPAWPSAVWGGPGQATPYSALQLIEMRAKVKALNLSGFSPA